jgi:hypothetical protein
MQSAEAALPRYVIETPFVPSFRNIHSKQMELEAHNQARLFLISLTQYNQDTFFALTCPATPAVAYMRVQIAYKVVA